MIPLVSGSEESNFDFTYPTTIILNYNGSTINTNQSNSSEFWITSEGHLNDVSQILGSDITNDLGWITAAGSDSWAGNFTFYYPLTYLYNKTEIDLNFSKYYLFSNPNNYINTTGDSWSSNFTLYYPLTYLYNKTEVDTNLSKYYLLSNPSNFINTTVDSWAGNFTFYYNKTDINNTLTLYYTQTQAGLNYSSISNNINLNLTASKNFARDIVNGNMTKVVLTNGSNAMTGDLNLGGKNITNVMNISFGGNQIYTNDTCIKIKGSSSLLEIC